MAILFPFVKGEGSDKDAFGKIYRFSSIARWIILFAWLYYSVLSIKLTDKMIIRKSLFGYIRIPYEDVKKIVVHGGGSNPLAAMAKIHGQKTFSIFALLTDYDQLLNEVIARCSNAVVIEK